MSFNDFMKGFQGGMGTVQDFRTSRQREKIYDDLLTQSGMELDALDDDRSRQGLPAVNRIRSNSESLLGRLSDKMDPVLARWLEKLGRGTGVTESPLSQAIPVAGELPSPYGDEGATSVYAEELPDLGGLAGGGSVADLLARAADSLSPEELQRLKQFQMLRQSGGATGGGAATMGAETFDPSKLALADEPGAQGRRQPRLDPESVKIREAAARARAATAPAQSRAIETQVIDRTLPEPPGRLARAKNWATKYDGYGLATPEGAGRISRATRALGRAAAPVAIGTAAYGGMKAAIADEEGGGTSSDWRNMGGYDTPEAIENEYGEVSYGEDFARRGKQALKGAADALLGPLASLLGSDKAPAAKPSQAVPAPPPAAPSTLGEVGVTAKRGRASAISPEAATKDELAAFDISRFKQASDVPNFSTKDWEGHRKDILRSYMMHGMSYAEAWDKTNQQVVATQQRGFMHFANMALASMEFEGKSSPKAATAIRAAFQYFPSGSDIKIGEYNGHLVAFGADEETGKPEGSPVVVTPELLQKVMANFKDPMVWANYSLDSRKVDVEQNLGQQRLGIMREGLGVDRANAVSARIAALGGADGKGAMKRTDAATNRRSFEDAAAEMAPSSKDSILRSQLIAIMAALDQEAGGWNPEQVAADVKNLLQKPGGKEKLQEFYASIAGQ